MISLLLHAKPRMSVNNKDIIQMYTWVIANLFISQKTAPINASFVESKRWLLVMFTYQSFFCTIMCYPFIFSWVISTYRPRRISRTVISTLKMSLMYGFTRK